MARLSESEILARVMARLSQLGCPDVRPAEGSTEWDRVRGSYTNTPDLVAGPLVGNGAPEDFLIDAFSPKGDQYFNPLAGAPGAAETVQRLVEQRGQFIPADLGSEYEPFYGPMNKKIAKYSLTRDRSPMLGLAMYFFVTGNTFAGPLFALIHAIAAVERAFDLTSGEQGRAVAEALSSTFGQGNRTSIILCDLKVPLSFLMLHADSLTEGQVDEKTLLLVSVRVVHDQFRWKEHPVIKWLNDLANGPLPGRLGGENA